jgi:hypothetical protein
MKRNHLIAIVSLLFLTLYLIGCQKTVLDGMSENERVASSAMAKTNACRTTVIDWSTVARWEFNYNEKGLADRWIIDYGFGAPLHTNDMMYDNNDRLIQSEEFYFGSNYLYQFYYSGKRMTRLTRVNTDNSADFTDFTFTYNSKGQMVRQDDMANDIHIVMAYDVMGNCTRTDLLFGDELIFSDNYTFSSDARSPRIAVPGINIGFPFYGIGGFGDKWMFTSNRTEVYENGDVFILNDYDPDETTIVTSSHNYPSHATYFDRVSEGAVAIAFEYENCGGSSNASSGAYAQVEAGSQLSDGARQNRSWFVRGSATSFKEQFEKLRSAKSLNSKRN